ncbi:hypothetical protein GT354_02030 [Streptomyces sp. SID3343]|nr:hypothetical protein [Streptomyces sp. SID3343]
MLEPANTEHRPAALPGHTPLEACQPAPTPLNDIPATNVWIFTPEDDSRTHVITSHGVGFHNHHYIADRMTAQTGPEVTVRFMPHRTHEIAICTPRGRPLGTHIWSRTSPPIPHPRTPTRRLRGSFG